MPNHRVYFYEQDAALIDRLTEFVKKGLEANETVFVIATEEHRSALKGSLMADNHIGASTETTGRYVPLDASDILSRFMHQGWPNERLFRDAIRHLLAPHIQGTKVRIYGEMVAVLMAQGNELAAVQLERLWNKFLASTDACSLLCAYHKSAFPVQDMTFILNQICACHDEIVGRPTYTSDPTVNTLSLPAN